MTSTSPLISLQGVCFAPGGVNVLQGVTFQSTAPRIGVVGRNGSGKTSLARMMAVSEAAAGVTAILEQFDKAHWAKAPIVQLSQGQRQLVCLMSVLAMQPRVIILDEPFAGLDIPTTLQLARVLDGLTATLVLITHNPAVLAAYDHVIWVEGGQIVQDGPVGDVVPAFETRMAALGGGDDLSDLSG